MHPHPLSFICLLLNVYLYFNISLYVPTYLSLSFFLFFSLSLSSSPLTLQLEAGTAPVQLSTGDYLHFYAAATPGWVEHGNYTAGWVILDKDDPRIILQRSTEHILVPTLPYMQVCLC